MRSMDKEGFGTFFRPMSRQQQRAFAKQEGVPFFIRWLLWRHVAAYQK